MLFNESRTRTDVQFKLYISYLELYNETGYDLLDPSHETKALEDLPKVSMLEDEHGECVAVLCCVVLCGGVV
jgi:kinesin family member 6/9